MSKPIIGLLFIVCGILYGSLAIDSVYNHTLGYLVRRQWVKPPPDAGKVGPSLLGRKVAIILYASALIIIGIFILWNR